MQIGDLIFSGSLKFNVLDQCLDFDLQYAGHIKSLTQVSSYCRYYNTAGCSGAHIFAYNSAVQNLTDTDAQSLFTDAKSVYCLESADVKDASNHDSAGIASSPREVKFASKYDFKGVKYSANAMNHCENLPKECDELQLY